MVDVSRRHFSGHRNLSTDRRHSDDNEATDLAAILRNVNTEFNLTRQSGTGTIIMGGTDVTITFGTAMPDATYRVIVTFTSIPDVSANGGAQMALFVDAKLAASFDVTASPAGATAVAQTFDWVAIHETRLNANV